MRRTFTTFRGNHDAYSDQFFDYFIANSVQGQATGYTQVSWIRQFVYGKYHFLGINTADNSGDSFSLSWPWGDYAGLDSDELEYIQNELSLHDDADLTIVFGHHPVTDTGVSDDTWLYYGASEFVSLLDQQGASLYGYGHTHRYSEELFKGDSYTGQMTGDGIVYLNIDSIGKSTENHFSVVAIDCNGLSTKTQAIDSWPLVLITTPVDRDLNGIPNPYAYSVPDAADNPLRALVFDTSNISQVQYRIDGGSQWHPMQAVSGNPHLWEATWDNTGTAEGEHTIEVQAAGTTVQSDVISVYVASSNQAPMADDQSVDTNEDTGIPIVLSATDPDGDILTYEIVLPPVNGTLSGSPPNLTYTPNADFNGQDSFTFQAFDGSVDSNEATIVITVQSVNDSPVAADDAYSMDQGSTLTVFDPGVLENDIDIDLDTLNAILIDSPSHGSLDLSPGGGFEYTPDSAFTGIDSYTYAADDEVAQSPVATVTITVSPVAVPDNEPPDPDPMVWSQPPQALDSTTISMTASTASDPSGVEYYFTCVSGNGHDSDWQTSPSYVDSGLAANTEYTYTVKARDLSVNQNETGVSTAASATTAEISNTPPAFTSDPIVELDGVENVFYSSSIADNAIDPDPGDTLSFSKVDGPEWLSVANDGSLSGIPGAEDVGLNTWTVRVEDQTGGFDEAFLQIIIDAAGQDVDYWASGESTAQGTVSGSYSNTRLSDDIYEEVTEELKAGKWSQLSHTWSFDIVGDNSVVFMVEAYHSSNDEGDDFVFAYSTDNVVFTEMFTVTQTQDNNTIQSFELPPFTTGIIYIRVEDTDNTRNNTVLDTLYVDYLLIRTSGTPAEPGAAFNPLPGDGENNVPTDVVLNWSAGAGAQWHDVYFGTDSAGISLVSSGQAETTYDPGPLSEDTTYLWRIDDGNSAGTTTGALWQFTTAAGSCVPSKAEVESIVTDTLKGPAGTSYGQAIVIVVDNCGNLLSGATVTGHFTDAFSDSGSKETDENGQAVFVTNDSIKKPEFGFEVDSVTVTF